MVRSGGLALVVSAVFLQIPPVPESGPGMLLEGLLGLAVTVLVLAVLGYGFLLLWRRIAESVRADRRERE